MMPNRKNNSLRGILFEIVDNSDIDNLLQQWKRYGYGKVNIECFYDALFYAVEQEKSINFIITFFRDLFLNPNRIHKYLNAQSCDRGDYSVLGYIAGFSLDPQLFLACLSYGATELSHRLNTFLRDSFSAHTCSEEDKYEHHTVQCEIPISTVQDVFLKEEKDLLLRYSSFHSPMFISGILTEAEEAAIFSEAMNTVLAPVVAFRRQEEPVGYSEQESLRIIAYEISWGRLLGVDTNRQKQLVQTCLKHLEKKLAKDESLVPIVNDLRKLKTYGEHGIRFDKDSRLLNGKRKAHFLMKLRQEMNRIRAIKSGNVLVKRKKLRVLFNLFDAIYRTFSTDSVDSDKPLSYILKHFLKAPYGMTKLKNEDVLIQPIIDSVSWFFHNLLNYPESFRLCERNIIPLEFCESPIVVEEGGERRTSVASPVSVVI